MHFQMGRAYKKLGDLERVRGARLGHGGGRGRGCTWSWWRGSGAWSLNAWLPSMQAQQQLEVALSFSSSSADAGSIKTAIEKLALNEEQEEDEL